ncbi:hypothetical protein Pcinc_017328 [Petrolisthes cinctipes]|uniref:Tectonin beta-propeller repeat-containing protein 2 n=1 Tax=Petrolisthes cinctipes TaxID=88211 RepID=A0AAE1FQH7_PETCI|nr:hypothetical protein Pcinc_017328 [Petrolisthes cinctipes]
MAASEGVGPTQGEGLGDLAGVWKEWVPLNPLLDQLPQQFQRGLTSSDLHLTCVAALPHHLVLGTNVGLVYLAHLPSANLMRLYCENSALPVSCVAGVRTVDDMVAAGSEDGTITIFQLPRVTLDTTSSLNLGFTLGGSKGGVGVRPTVKRFTVGRVHQAQVLCLTWSRNGMRLFSGDAEGVVSVVDINYQTSECTARTLTREAASIVQLSYIYQHLAVSTRERAVVYSLATGTACQVGQKPRKHPGPFGCLWSPCHSQSDLVLYTARPGLRFWSATSQGEVLNTHIIKDLPPSTQAILLNPVKEKVRDGEGYSFGILHIMGTSLIVSHTSHWIFLIDIASLRVLTYSGQFRDIRSVAVSDEEIFVLEGGRSLSCLSVKPLKLGERKLRSGLGNITYPQSNNLRDLGTRLANQGSGLIDHITRVGNIVAARMTEHSGSSIITGQVIKPKTDEQQSSVSSSGPQTGDREAEGSQSVCQDSDLRRQKAGHLRSSSSGNVQVGSSSLDIGGSSIQPRMVQSFNIFPSLLSSSSIIPSTSSSIIATLGKTPPLLDVSVMGEEKVPGDFEEIVTGAQIIAPEGTENDPIVLKDRSGKKKKSRKTDINTSQDTMSIKSSESSDQSSSPPFVCHSDTHQFLPTTNQDLAESSEGTGGETGGSEASSSVTSGSNGQRCDGTLDVGKQGASVCGSDSASASPLHTGGESRSAGDGSEDIHCPIDITLDPLDTRPYDDFKHTIEKKESFLADILGLECLKMDHEHHDRDESEGVPRLRLNREVSLESTSCSTPSTVKELSPAPDSSSGDFYAQYLRNISLSSVESGMESHAQATEDTNSLNADNRSSEGSDDVERLLSNLSEDRTSCLSYGPPSGSSILSLGNRVQGESLGMGGCDGREGAASVCESKDGLTVVNNSSEIADVSWSYTASDTQECQEYEEETLAGGWLKQRLPSDVMNLSTSKSAFVFIDSHGCLYHRNELAENKAWQKVRVAAKATQVSLSPSGHVTWVRFGGSAFASRSLVEGVGTRLTPVAKGVQDMSVDEEFSWYIDIQGQVYVRPSLGCGSPSLVSTEGLDLVRVVCQDRVVWALDRDGTLVFRIGVSSQSPTGHAWAKTEGPGEEGGVAALALGPKGRAWVVGGHGGVYFRLGVTARHPQGKDLHWWQVVTSQYMLEGGGEGVLLTTSSEGVFLADPTSDCFLHHPLHSTGHWWGGVGEGVWSTLCAEGMYQQSGALACLSPLGQLFLLNPSTNTIVPLELPMNQCVLCVSQRPEAMWVLTSGGHVYVRAGLSATSVLGSHWLTLDLSQIGDIELCHVSCGMEVVWGVDTRGGVYMRQGPLTPTPAISLPPAWIEVDPTPLKGNAVFTKVYVGMKLHMVWGVDSCQRVYVREAIFPELPIGLSWVPVPGINALHLSISEDMVYALTPSGHVYRRLGVTETNYIGDAWERVPGNLAKISTTTDNQLWGLDTSGHIIRHEMVDTADYDDTDPSSTTLHFPIAPRLSESSETSDWEVV